jgi:hypothetical protein
MQDALATILQVAIVGVFAATHNRTNSDEAIVTIKHELPLYRGVLEWKNDIGAGGCDVVKQACFSFRACFHSSGSCPHPL